MGVLWLLCWEGGGPGVPGVGVSDGGHTGPAHPGATHDGSSGRQPEWNVVVNMINAALFYSNVPA